MSGILMRVIVAVICVIVTFALIPPVARIIGFSVDGDLWLVLRICIAGLAALYILRGTKITP